MFTPELDDDSSIRLQACALRLIYYQAHMVFLSILLLNLHMLCVNPRSNKLFTERGQAV